MDDEERQAAVGRIEWLRLAAERARRRAKQPNLKDAEIRQALSQAQQSEASADELQAELDAPPSPPAERR